MEGEEGALDYIGNSVRQPYRRPGGGIEMKRFGGSIRRREIVIKPGDMRRVERALFEHNAVLESRDRVTEGGKENELTHEFILFADAFSHNGKCNGR